MILSLLVLIGGAWAQDADPSALPGVSDDPVVVETVPDEPITVDGVEPPPDDELTKYRARFDVLTDRAIGTASVPVEYDWRRSTLQFGVQFNHLFELNNFNTLRGGVFTRFPTGGMLVEIGASYARVWDSRSSELLAFTPYRQPGRPDRFELDVLVGVPLAEGVVTTLPRWFPSVQMVFSAHAGFRYSLYPSGFAGLRRGQVGRAIFAPGLLQEEIDNLDDNRLAAMAVDPGRYGVMVGFSNDLYFKQGFFVSPRFMMAVPLLAAASNSRLLFWADLSVSVGVAL